eukprot:TRINITY_DN14219_c0_g1_i1.p1 TRINITY_DN14219_c0_g1~~TRINITY_DN14219_c0_g1_i1.p1  ORF type:complete len:806 (-),score=209.22 TRINITY_DN14219_c0_g1_i1:64-2481(-)
MLRGPNRTSIGGLVFGGEPERNLQAAYQVKDTRQFLESGLIYPKPLPWDPAAAGDAARSQESLQPSERQALGDHVSEKIQQLLQTALAEHAGRLADCERRVSNQESQALLLQRCEGDIQLLRQAADDRSRDSIGRLVTLETQVLKSQQDEAFAREQLLVLQAEFRDFAAQSLGRQRADHADIESQVGQALARNNLSSEEWRNAVRQKDTQMQGELERLGASIDDLRERMMSSQAELRVRLTALEVPKATTHADGAADAGLGSAEGAYWTQTVEFLKHQIEKFHQSSVQASANLSELQSRLDGEASARAAAQQDHSTRIEALNQALSSARALLSQSIAQRVEVIEERLGVERQELLSKQDRLRDELAAEGQDGHLRLQDLSSKIQSALDTAEKRCREQIADLRDRTTAKYEDLEKAFAAENEVKKSFMSSLLQKFQGQTDWLQQSAKSLKSEVDAALRQVRDTVSSEGNARRQAEHRLFQEVTEAVQKALANESASTQQALKAQAESVAAEFERIRHANSDRADRLSRYVDAALADAGLGLQGRRGSQDLDTSTAELLDDVQGRLDSLRKDLEQQGAAFEQRFNAFSDDIKLKFSSASESQERENKAAYRDAEQAVAAAEQRSIAGQEELKQRFERYVKHFDTAINSVQAAILRPALQDPKPFGRMSSAAPAPLPPTYGLTRLDAHYGKADAPSGLRSADTETRENSDRAAPLNHATPVAALQDSRRVPPWAPEPAYDLAYDHLLAHERIQQRLVLPSVASQDPAALRVHRDPLAVQEANSPHEEVADEVLSDLWAKAAGGTGNSA